jgi:glycerol-3-phosphate dehydrogenase
MAERVVDKSSELLEERYKMNFKSSATEKIALCGGPFKNYKEVKKYIQKISERITPSGFDEKYAQYLVNTFGRQTDLILAIFDKLSTENTNAVQRMGQAEYVFCVENEMITNPMDFFIRRTGRSYFDIGSLPILMETILQTHQQLFNSDEKATKEYRTELENQMEKHSRVARVV